jgi:hypothetical protein
MNAAKNPIVEVLERRFLPTLQEMAQRLRTEFPDICVNTWSSAIGSAVTNNPGHNLGIDCLFKYAPRGEADNVALCIGVIQVNDNPHLSDLAVCWGAGSDARCIGIDFLDTPVPWSADAIRTIENALPMLFDTLVAALKNPPFPKTTA